MTYALVFVHFKAPVVEVDKEIIEDLHVDELLVGG